MIIDEIFKQSGEFGPAQWCLLSLFSLLNWTCSDAWKSSLIQSTFFIGSVAGTLVLGSLSDSYGRVPMLITAHFLAVIGNLLTVYLHTTIWTLSLARSIAGIATDSNFFMMYIIVMEYVKPSLRTIGLNLCIGLWYCVGCILTPWLAILTKNWRTFLLVISIPNLVIPIICFFIPESAQWLLSVGRTNDAMACYQKVAHINGKEIPNHIIQRFKAYAASNDVHTNTVNLVGLFKTPRLRRKTCVLIFKTIVLSLCYDAIARNVEGLGLDPFTVFTITSCSILPSCFVILLLQDRNGRKILAISFLLLTGLFNFIQGGVIIFGTNITFSAAILGLFGRFSVNIAYNSGTQYAAELIPTQARGQGLALMHAIGYAATFFSPQILFLMNFWAAAPQMILGLLSVFGATLCLFLPETLNRLLPITLQDGESFGEDEKFWDFLKSSKI
ncbi:hypothetical protein RUM44_012962 [Polyplax serrata]|uniref:Major facilitator superfamily (MFS) profile domain-containing protein n=1 Tax=Polyplax serrata TaxID=468196 RepID=A0ABR1BCT2_POLSC